MTLFHVSQASRTLFGGAPHFHIPHNLYFDLRDERFASSIHQFAALSAVSGYALTDWLNVFGFQLDDIPHLQILLPFPRTVLLDSNVYDRNHSIPWFKERRRTPEPTHIVPLIQLLDPGLTEQVASLLRKNRASFAYAKVGPQDAFAFPELLPGSIVRADPRNVENALAAAGRGASQTLFLVEHAGGLNCCRLQPLAAGRVALISIERPCARVELQLGKELKILGTIDLEIRNVRKMRRPENHRGFEESKNPNHSPLQRPASDLRHLLRRGRLRVGLSCRQASGLSRKIAEELGDERYYTAAGSLSDYEATNRPPRHIHKIITLCTLYSIDFWQFLKAAGLPIERLGQEHIPDELAGRPQLPDSSSYRQRRQKPEEGVFLRNLFERFEEIPFFLRNSLPAISGLPHISLRDVFWVGDQKHDSHPSIKGAQFLIVNRHIKQPEPLKWEPPENQPLYLLSRRNGAYFCGTITQDGKRTVLHSFPEEIPGPKPAHSRADAEIVGQIVTVVRRIPAGT